MCGVAVRCDPDKDVVPDSLEVVSLDFVKLRNQMKAKAN